MMIREIRQLRTIAVAVAIGAALLTATGCGEEDGTVEEADIEATPEEELGPDGDVLSEPTEELSEEAMDAYEEWTQITREYIQVLSQLREPEDFTRLSEQLRSMHTRYIEWERKHADHLAHGRIQQAAAQNDQVRATLNALNEQLRRIADSESLSSRMDSAVARSRTEQESRD